MAFVTMAIRGDKEVKSLMSGFGAPNAAISRAINKGVAKGRTEAWAVVKDKFPVKQKQFYGSLKVLKAGVNNLTGRLTAYKSKFTYLELGGAKQFKAGVKVQPRKGVRKTSRDLVLGTTRTGKSNVYKPKGATVETAMSWSAAQMLDDPAGAPTNALWRAQKAAADAYEAELLRQIDLIAKKKV